MSVVLILLSFECLVCFFNTELKKIFKIILDLKEELEK